MLPSQFQKSAPTAEILTVGTELLLGDILNTNARYLSRQLATCGISVYYQTTVGDNSRRLMKAVADAFSRSDILICTGGLGPTKDDLTKETVAAYFGLPLVEDQKALARMEEYFAKRNRPMTKNNRKQAMVPKGARVLYNENGTAPGIWIEVDGKTAILLPGPPKELEPMFAAQVMPKLAARSGRTLLTRCVKVFGLGEALIETKIADLLAGENPTVALYAKAGEVEVHVTAGAEDAKEARSMCGVVCRQLVERLGDKVFTVEGKSLSDVVVEQLRKHEKKVVTAESCTGGMVAKRLTDVPGASAVFEQGFVTYSDAAKHQLLDVSQETLATYGAVSEQAAKEMALGALKRSGADLALAVTGFAGPTGGTPEQPVGLVYLAVADAGHLFVQKIQTGQTNNRESVRNLAALYGMDMLRRLLLLTDSLADAALYTQAEPLVEEETAPFSSESDLLTLQEQTIQAKPQPQKPWYLRLAQNFIPWKGDSRGELVRKSVLLVAIPVFIISAGILLSKGLDSMNSQLMLEDLRDLYAQEETVTPQQKEEARYPEGYQDSFFSLYQMNHDVKGYLKLDGTQIDFPVVQYQDNDYYLRRNFKGQKSDHGVAFFDYRCDLKDRSDNTIIYGHNMRDNTMFGTLTKFKDVGYYKQHPTMSMDTVYEDGTYLVFAAFYANASIKSGPMFDYHNYVNLHSEEEFNDFYNKVMQRSLFKTGVDVKYGDELLTLSTCTYEITEGRFVVMARRLRPGESATVNTTLAEVNPAPLYPMQWYEKFNLPMPDYYINGEGSTGTTQGTGNQSTSTTKGDGGMTTQTGGPWYTGTRPTTNSTTKGTGSQTDDKTTTGTGSSATETTGGGETTTTLPGETTTTGGDTSSTDSTDPTDPTETTQPTESDTSTEPSETEPTEPSETEPSVTESQPTDDSSDTPAA